jgi:hypothetical protein
VTALRLAQPEDFLLEGGSPGGWCWQWVP